MKWILYWMMYMSSLQDEPRPLSGAVVVWPDSVMFYTQTAGYRTFPIIFKDKEIISERFPGGPTVLSQGIYLLRQDTTSVTLIIRAKTIEYTVFTPNTRELITLKRRL